MRKFLLGIIFCFSIIFFLLVIGAQPSWATPKEGQCECQVCHAGTTLGGSRCRQEIYKVLDTACGDLAIMNDIFHRSETVQTTQSVERCNWRFPDPYCCCKRGQSGVEQEEVECLKVTGIQQKVCNKKIYDQGGGRRGDVYDGGTPGQCRCPAGAEVRIGGGTTNIVGTNKVVCESERYRAEGCSWEPPDDWSSPNDVQYIWRSFKQGAPAGQECDFRDISTNRRIQTEDRNFVEINRLKDQAKALNKMGLTSVSQLIGRVIKILFAFIGSIAFVLYILSGFMWMTAGGNSERVTKAKSILVWTSLGVVVMLASYVLVDFVFKSLANVR